MVESDVCVAHLSPWEKQGVLGMGILREGRSGIIAKEARIYWGLRVALFASGGGEGYSRRAAIGRGEWKNRIIARGRYILD